MRLKSLIFVFALGLIGCFSLSFPPVTSAQDLAGEEAVEPKPWAVAIFDDRPPYMVRDAEGRIRGFDAAVAEAISKILKQPIEVRFLPEDEITTAILKGEVDVVAGLPRRREYEKIFDYSDPMFVNRIRLFVHEDTVFIHTLRDLRGLRVGINQDMDVAEFIKLVPGIQIVMEPNTRTALMDLASRNITVYLGDEHESRYLIRRENIAGIKTVGGALILEQRHFGVRKGKKLILGQINSSLEQMAGGLELQAIQDEWLGSYPPWGEVQRRFVTILLSVLGLVATVLLVTLVWNQKLADAVDQRTREVQAEREHFQNLFDHASDAILIINPHDSGIMEANKAFEEMMGYAREELLEIKLSDLEASHTQDITGQIQSVMRRGGSTMFETRVRNSSNQLIDLLIHARPFPYRGRTMVEAIARDITERKKIQTMKDTILQDVAHELKTPMSKMSMSVDLLARHLAKQHKDEYGKFFDICHRSIQRLQSTIEGILNLSRLESQTMRVRSDIFPVQDVLLNVIDELMVFAQKKGIQVAHELPRDPVLLLGDPEMITRLFVNIIHNAIKFTDKGTVWVSISRESLFGKISVKDEGMGLEREDLKRIFSRFYQKMPTYEGCGIGLTIAQKIVALHNGVIWAESAGLGKGTTMHVMFPLYRKTESKPEFLKTYGTRTTPSE